LPRWGSVSRGPPLFFACPFLVRSDLGHALSAVLCPLCGFSIPFGLRPTGLLVFLSDASACASFGASLSLLRSFLCMVGPRCFCLVFWLLLAPLPVRCCFPSPRGWSRVAPWPSFYAGTSLWVSGCSCDGLVALLYCWECGCALSSLLHFVSWQQRLLALCGVFITFSTMLHVLLGCSV